MNFSFIALILAWSNLGAKLSDQDAVAGAESVEAIASGGVADPLGSIFCLQRLKFALSADFCSRGRSKSGTSSCHTSSIDVSSDATQEKFSIVQPAVIRIEHTWGVTPQSLRISSRVWEAMTPSGELKEIKTKKWERIPATMLNSVYVKHFRMHANADQDITAIWIVRNETMKLNCICFFFTSLFFWAIKIYMQHYQCMQSNSRYQCPESHASDSNIWHMLKISDMRMQVKTPRKTTDISPHEDRCSLFYAVLGPDQNIPAAAQAFLQPGCWQNDMVWSHSERNFVSSWDMCVPHAGR